MIINSDYKSEAPPEIPYEERVISTLNLPILIKSKILPSEVMVLFFDFKYSEYRLLNLTTLYIKTYEASSTIKGINENWVVSRTPITLENKL